jgi:hypothetical protein
MFPFRGLFAVEFEIVRRDKGHNKRVDRSSTQLNVVADED